MENQEVEVQGINPKQEYEAIQKRILDGDTETAHKFAAGEYRSLKESADQYVEPSIKEDFVEPHQELETSQVEDSSHAQSEEDTPFDAEAHERKLYDEEAARWQEQVDAAAAESARIAEEAEVMRLQNEKLLKELEEARRANDVEEEGDLLDIIAEEPEPVNTVQYDAKVADDAGVNSEIKAELEQLKRQIQEKDSWENTVKSYSKFWDTDAGKDFAPSGDREKSMKEFNEFYSDLTDSVGDKEALRLMHDIRKHDINDFYKDKLDNAGVRVPDDFKTMYDSFEVYAFANGKVIDARRGMTVDSGKDKYSNLEDAYWILNKDKIRQNDKINAINAAKEKLSQHQNVAIQVKPENYRAIPTAVQNASNVEYQRSVLRKAVASGYKGGSLNDISDPVVRQEMQAIHSLMRK